MTRYFYIEPLDAAIMAKRYGMRFDSATEDGDADDADAVEGKALADTACAPRPIKRFVIRAETLHLLEPQLGDLIEREGRFHFVVTAEEHATAERVPELANQTVSLEVVNSWANTAETFIRMRGGQAFIHPEREVE